MSKDKQKVDIPLHICFMGLGKACKTNASAIRKIDPSVVLSFASRDHSKANEYKEKYKGKHSFASYESALSTEDINVVFITTPPHRHYDLAKSALNHGKHVIVEKPPFYSSKELLELGTLADEKRLQLLVAENYYYKPIRTLIEEYLSKELIGKPIYIAINAVKTQKIEGNWRNQPDIAFKGALFEGGIHWISFLNNIAGDIQHINGYSLHPKEAIEKSIMFTGQLKSGTMLNLMYSWEVNSLLKGLRISKIFGSEGSITFETNGIFLFLRGKKVKVKWTNPFDITGTRRMLKDFLTAIQTNECAMFTWKKAHQDLVVIEKIYQSINTKSEI